LDRLFQAFGQPGSLDVGGKPEFRIRKADEDGGGTSFADYVWKPVVLIEMKKRGDNLEQLKKLPDDYVSILRTPLSLTLDRNLQVRFQYTSTSRGRAQRHSPTASIFDAGFSLHRCARSSNIASIMMNEVHKLDIRCDQIESKLKELEKHVARLERFARSSENATKGFGYKGAKMVTPKSKS
jgi:hypothetical protein